MLQKLFRYCLSKKQSPSTDIKNQEENNTEAIHSLSVRLYENDIVDVIFLHPKIDNLSIIEISTEAEKFAELLIYAISSLMEPKVLTIIHDKAKNTNNNKEQLFYDNVLSYYDLIKIEFEQKLLNNGPLIRPRSVFNSK
jgi:hypothetical protein